MTDAYSRPAARRLSNQELVERIRAVGSTNDGLTGDRGSVLSDARAGDRDEVLTDGRIALRQWRLEDAPAIIAGLQDGSAASWIVGMPHPYGLQDASSFLARAEHDRLTAEYAHLAVTDAATGRVLGAVGMNFRHDRQAGEIGYWTNPDDRGLGVAPRAVALISRWAFDALLLPRVELIIHPLNFESQAIASRSGFRREGLMRSYLEHRGRRNDYYSFARLPDDPAPAPHPTLSMPLAAAPASRASSAGASSSSRDSGATVAGLVLRPWRLRDAEAAQAMIAGDERIRRWCIGIPDPCTVEDERRFIAESAHAWFEDGAPTFAICDAGTGELLGSIGLERAPGGDMEARDGGVLGTPMRDAREHRMAEVGYLVRESARGRGVASAALQAVTRWALEEGDFGACEALIEPDNAASAQTAQRAGYVRSGESRVYFGSGGRGGPHDTWRFPPAGRHGIKSD